MRLRAALAAAFLLAQGGAAGAHEFWMLPDRFDPEAGGSVVLRLEVGQNYSGDRVAITRSFITRLLLISASQRQDLTRAVPDGNQGELGLAVGAAGSTLVAIDTAPSSITLPADKFEEYLKLEGLDAVLRTRAAKGQSSAPGRERFRRNVKTLVHAGGTADAAFAQRTGQRLELVPLADPSTLHAGDALSLQVFFDGRPLAGSLVKFWRTPGRLEAVHGTTDDAGVVKVVLADAGPWMASTVHMIPAEGTREADWDSYWGNLTFEAGPPSQ